MTEDAPRFAFDGQRLRAETIAAVDRRTVAFGPLIRAGKLDEGDANRELNAWLTLRDEWCRAASAMPDAPMIAPASPAQCLAALQVALTRADRQLNKLIAALPAEAYRAARNGALLSQLADQFGDVVAPMLAAHDTRDAIEALLWWQQRGGPLALPQPQRAAA